MNLVSPNRIRFAVFASCVVMTATVAAAPPPTGASPASPSEQAGQRDPDTARHEPATSEAADERAADMLNQRDDQKMRERNAKGDRTLQRADKVTRESKPDANQPKDRPSQLSPHPQ